MQYTANLRERIMNPLTAIMRLLVRILTRTTGTWIGSPQRRPDRTKD